MKPLENQTCLIDPVLHGVGKIFNRKLGFHKEIPQMCWLGLAAGLSDSTESMLPAGSQAYPPFGWLTMFSSALEKG